MYDTGLTVDRALRCERGLDLVTSDPTDPLQVNHVEPWEKGSRKTAGQTGMCGGVS